MSQKELIADITTFCGGRAAEKIVFDSVTTGASNDIEKATKMARAMVTMYGMSEEFGLIGLESIESRYLDGRAVMTCGEETAGKVDKVVMRILSECYQKAEEMLSENREVMDKLAEFLIEKETITGKEFMKIFREVKGIEAPEEVADKKKAETTEETVEAGNVETVGNEVEAVSEVEKAAEVVELEFKCRRVGEIANIVGNIAYVYERQKVNREQQMQLINK